MTNPLQIIALLSKFAEITNEKPSAQRLTVMADILTEYSLEQIEAGLRLYFHKGKFFPAPSEIIENIKNSKDEAEDLWNRILTHVRRNGSQVTPELPEPALRALENIGGIQAVGMIETEKLPILAKQFRESFVAFDRRAEYKKLLPSSDLSERLKKLSDGIGNINKERKAEDGNKNQLDNVIAPR